MGSFVERKTSFIYIYIFRFTNKQWFVNRYELDLKIWIVDVILWMLENSNVISCPWFFTHSQTHITADDNNIWPNHWEYNKLFDRLNNLCVPLKLEIRNSNHRQRCCFVGIDEISVVSLGNDSNRFSKTKCISVHEHDISYRGVSRGDEGGERWRECLTYVIHLHNMNDGFYLTHPLQSIYYFCSTVNSEHRRPKY